MRCALWHKEWECTSFFDMKKEHAPNILKDMSMEQQTIIVLAEPVPLYCDLTKSVHLSIPDFVITTVRYQ